MWSRGRLQERLDRFIYTKLRFEQYMNNKITHLPRIMSVRCPILLGVENGRHVSNLSKAFHFLGFWLLHDGFNHFVDDDLETQL